MFPSLRTPPQILRTNHRALKMKGAGSPLLFGDQSVSLSRMQGNFYTQYCFSLPFVCLSHAIAHFSLFSVLLPSSLFGSGRDTTASSMPRELSMVLGHRWKHSINAEWIWFRIL